jgi:hypothetical protein
MSSQRRPDHETQPGDEQRSPVDTETSTQRPGNGEVAGVVGDASATRSGDDTRRRGWFWHWNSIVTQYAPLLGLKGVGLLNSYTVWTDRREESPHRGYAFPSQQREADFYGEDRAELITINKILVALDLIEIRKEMVLRTDDKGRRWRVPHNFYRVKDKGDDFTLTGDDVMRVVELADRDRAVYRYLRHIFSAKFQPIDSNNVWTGILETIRQDPTWQRLATRVARDEARASARTRAGHAARKANFGMPVSVDTPAAQEEANDTAGVENEVSQQTNVASTNKGQDVDVGESNTGSSEDSATSVGPTSNALPTSVAPTNTTYNQKRTTTTTTGKWTEAGDKRSSPPRTSITGERDKKTMSVAMESQSVPGAHGSGPGAMPPGDAPGQLAALQAFEEANSRPPTAAERKLLAEIASRFEPVARSQGSAPDVTGWSWVKDAIYEAVEAGSAYVAPRRVREILSRWEREGPPSDPMEEAQAATRNSRAEGPPAAELELGEAPDIALPHGYGSLRTWAFTASLLTSVIDPGRLASLLSGTAIIGYRDGEVVIVAPTTVQAARLAGEYHELITRKLSEAMRRPVRISIQTDARSAPATHRDVSTPVDMAAGDIEPDSFVAPIFFVSECGLTSEQVWVAVLEEVAAQGSVSHANREGWLRPLTLIGRNEDATLVLGAPNELTRKRVAHRFLPPLRAAIRAVTGRAIDFEIVLSRDWLATHGPDVDRSDRSASSTGT